MMAVISFFLMICIFPSFSVKSQFICVSVYLSSNGTGSDSHKQSHPAFSIVHLFSHFSLSQSWQHNFVPHSVISYSEQNISSSSNPLFPHHPPPRRIYYCERWYDDRLVLLSGSKINSSGSRRTDRHIQS